MRLNSHPSGRHFLQIPGPTNVPDRILRAMDHPTIDNAKARDVVALVIQQAIEDALELLHDAREKDLPAA